MELQKKIRELKIQAVEENRFRLAYLLSRWEKDVQYETNKNSN